MGFRSYLLMLLHFSLWHLRLHPFCLHMKAAASWPFRIGWVHRGLSHFDRVDGIFFGVVLLVDVFLGDFLFGGDFLFVDVIISRPARRDGFRGKCAGMVPSDRKNTYRSFECLGPRREAFDLLTVAMKVSVFELAVCRYQGPLVKGLTALGGLA